MPYFYESHMGGVFVTDNRLSPDDLYCDTCGDWDRELGHAETPQEARKLLKREEYPFTKDYINRIINSAFDEKGVH